MVKANYPDLLELVSLTETGVYKIAVMGQSTPADGAPRMYYVLSLSLANECSL